MDGLCPCNHVYVWPCTCVDVSPFSCVSMQVRVAVIGNVDSGKSTLVGVLTRAMLDDGRGAARAKV